ncbi:MAG: MgtC/SapB family protein [Caldilineaceae bacterium]|nr:MgtC/SapB family protein [Caldilineaceae bacterium]MCB0184407.1 MgtC/SapB family protein [Caldilineaceae bacterium]
MDLSSIDLSSIFYYTIQLGTAFLLTMPIAWERERATRIMGLRTFPLVALGSCAYILIGQSVVGDSPDAHARLIQGLVSGLGFIGGGAILKKGEGEGVRGTATAASVWTTGAVGTAVAFKRYEIAVVIVVLNFLILWWLSTLKTEIEHDE